MLGVTAEGGVYVSGGWVGPVERGSLNTEPRDGMSKRSRDKRTSNNTVVVRVMVRKKGILTEGSLDNLTAGPHQFRISCG